MAFLNLHVHYFTNIKTRRLVASLGPGAEVLPIKLWCHCCEHHPEDGILAGYTVDEIESLMDWRGTPGRALKAMVRLGFLEPGENCFRVHNWLEYEGHISAFKRRSRAANETRWKVLQVAPAVRTDPTLQIGPRDLEEAAAVPDGEPETHSGILDDESRTPSRILDGDSRNPSGILSDESRTPSRILDDNSRTPYAETRSPLTNHTHPHNQPSVLTYLNQPNHTIREEAESVAKEALTFPDPYAEIRSLIHRHASPAVPLTEPAVKVLVRLASKHGDAFREACRCLHPGVNNVVGYLMTVLESRGRPMARSRSR